MTDLDKAIAELRRVTPESSPWEVGDIGAGYSPVDYHIATILNAVLSGALIRALITQPQSDALAAVRAEARREERLAIIAGVDYEASVCPCEEDAVVMRDIARLIAADFSYADADAGLADTEGGET